MILNEKSFFLLFTLVAVPKNNPPVDISWIAEGGDTPNYLLFSPSEQGSDADFHFHLKTTYKLLF